MVLSRVGFCAAFGASAGAPGGGNCLGQDGYGVSDGDGSMRGSAGKYVYHGAVGRICSGPTVTSKRNLNSVLTRGRSHACPTPVVANQASPSIPSHQRREIDRIMRILSRAKAKV